MSSVFEPIVTELIQTGKLYSTPCDFQDYCKQHLINAKTAQKISIDSVAKLDPYLKANHFMVLRLGKSEMGKGTAFSLIKCPESLSDYFLIDKIMFKDTSPVKFFPDVHYSQLHCFNLIPNFTETCCRALNSTGISPN